jgi:hypothetical protein
MRIGSTLTLFAILCLAVASFVTAQEGAEKSTSGTETKVDIKKVLKATTCPMSGRPVNPEKFASYKESKVYMCCPNCVKAFPEKVKKDKMLAAKANHQLVATHQATQTKCAMNAKGKMNPKASTKIAGVTVNTCCKNCLGAIAKMDEKKQIETVFGKNFDKAFVVKAVEAKKKKEAEKKKTEEAKAAA